MKRALAVLAPLAAVAAALWLAAPRGPEREASLAMERAATPADGAPRAEFPGAEFDGSAPGEERGPPAASVPRNSARRAVQAPASAAGAAREAPAAAERAELEEGQPAVQVRVVDARTGEPVAGAVVRLRDMKTRRELRTDAGGHAATPWSGHRKVFVRVKADGYADGVDRVSPPGARTVELLPRDRLEVLVVDRRTGWPVPEAQVRIRARRARTDATGRFVLERFAFGEPVDVEVTAPGYPDQTLQLDARHGGDHVLELGPAVQLRGRVLDATTGEPVAGFLLSAPGGEGETDALGRFDLAVLPGSPGIPVELVRDGYCSAQATLEPSVVGVDLRIPRSAAIEGVVRGESGRPAARVLVGYAPAEHGRTREDAPLSEPILVLRPAPSAASARTDGQGRFRLDGVVPGEGSLRLLVVWVSASEGTSRTVAGWFEVDAPGEPGETTTVELDLRHARSPLDPGRRARR